MSETLRLALAPLRSIPGDLEGNVDRLEAAVRVATTSVHSWATGSTFSWTWVAAIAPRLGRPGRGLGRCWAAI